MSSPDIQPLPFAPYAQPSRPWNGLVILGEAPGATEIEQSRPFVGPSGQLLTEALEAVGIDREAALVANVFRYRPPKNQVKHFFGPAKAAGVSGSDLGRFRLGYVRAAFADELAELAKACATARAILALGSVPLWATTGLNVLTPNVGRVLPGRLSAPPVIPTYHPSFIMRGGYDLVQWCCHMELALGQLLAPATPP